ncbi:MAG: DNA repair protein RecO [Lachnospiraceae bacterium]|nr:DNA repair protein RecO [Lachnospiraceae bacterium]
MNDFTVTGIILKAEPIGDYDRRIVLLTKERGKISVFAKGALRPTNRFVACTMPFVFGTFDLYAGANSFSLNKAEISNYFEIFRKDLLLNAYGSYFLEIADYYGRENADNVGLMRLLYRALLLLEEGKTDYDFIKTVFEMKAIMLDGEFPDIPDANELPQGAKKAIRYIYDARPENAFAFQVSDETFIKLSEQAESVCKRTFDKEFASLEMIRFAKEMKE